MLKPVVPNIISRIEDLIGMKPDQFTFKNIFTALAPGTKIGAVDSFVVPVSDDQIDLMLQASKLKRLSLLFPSP